MRVLIAALLIVASGTACNDPDKELPRATGTWVAEQGPMDSENFTAHISEDEGQIRGQGTYRPAGSHTDPPQGVAVISGTLSGKDVRIQFRLYEGAENLAANYVGSFIGPNSISGDFAFQVVADGPVVHAPLVFTRRSFAVNPDPEKAPGKNRYGKSIF